MSQWGVCTRLVVGYTLTWASLVFPTLSVPHPVGTHCIQQLVHGSGGGEKVQKTKGGNPEAEFPPQLC